MKKTRAMLFAAMTLVLFSNHFAQQKDTTGCKDHPLFTRMPTYWIHNCDEKQFDAHDFIVGVTNGKRTTERVEGHLWRLNYYPQATATQKPSDLQIIRNYENAVRSIGGKVVWTDNRGRATFLIVKGGQEYWVDLSAEFTGKYGFFIVQKQAMAQDLQANAEVFRSNLRTTGHAAVYGILFDTDSAVIKPESAEAIGEIARLLQADPQLKIFVVGHTDNSGSVDHNLRLSLSRAQSVTQALMKEHGIAADRLKAFGCGPYAPVAPNDTEEGKAKNRRVELVKQ